jgi:copper chaperone CopZ
MQVFTFDVKCSDIKNMQDVMMIQTSLANSPGIDLVDVDVATQTIHVKTANQDGGVDVRRRLADSGFPQDHITLL